MILAKPTEDLPSAGAAARPVKPHLLNEAKVDSFLQVSLKLRS